MTITVLQRTNHFWLQKLREQIATINGKRKSERLERLFALDIALAYLFLYLFLEATIDEIIREILLRRGGLKERDRYGGRSRHLRDKLEFIFTEFCSQVPFEEFRNLRLSIQPLISIRNRIVHLEELSWIISQDEDQKPKEMPTRSTEYLTVEGLSQHYRQVGVFLAALAVTLNRGLENAKTEVQYEEGGWTEARTHNLIELVYEVSVPRLRVFEQIV